MSLRLFLMDLAAYSAQIAIVVIAGSLAPMLLRLRKPDALLIYRHALLATCLVLPLLQPWRRPVPDSPADVSVSMAAVTRAGAPAHRSLPWEQISALVLGAGMLARFGWLGVGLLRLRRYRRRAEPIAPLAQFDALRQRVGVRASICLSPDVSGAVTFGICNPVVLLPAEFLSFPLGAQEAILCHELTHVRRRDWAAAMLEEIVRAVFWFHPAIWWLLGQIQLSREQAVDAAVLRITASPEQYIDALLVAAGHLSPDLAPAPLFLRKTQLARRVALIMKDVPMSRKRLLSSLAAMCGALVVTARFATLVFPISAPAQEIVTKGEANLIHRAPVVYPPLAIEKGIQGTVIVSAILNDRGVVTDAHVISGPDALRGAALKSVLDWHYSTQAESPVEIAIDFKLPASGATPAPAPKSPPGAIKRIQFNGVSSAVRDKVLDKLPVHEGDTVQPGAAPDLNQTIQEVDEHLAANLHRTGADPNELALDVFYRTPVTQPAEKAQRRLRALDGKAQRIRVGGNVQATKIIYKPAPAYPVEAKEQRIQGTVRLKAIIGKDGSMQDMKFAFGDPALATYDKEAVRQWRYYTTMLNCEPVEVATVIDVNYTLSH